MSKKIEEYPEIAEILKRLAGGKPSEVIALFVPSHDRKERKLQDKAIWEKQALDLFGKLFGGATAFTNLSGIYQPSRSNKPLYDEPTMIQSLTETENVSDEDNLIEFAEFCRNMGKKTNQAGVGVVINNKFIDIPIKHSEEE